MRRASRSTARWWIAAAGALAITGLIASDPADACQSPPRPEPRLPGAVARPPDGIGPGAPFDVPAFFAAPPPNQNAAPLYIDALFEFGPELAVCFPEDAETARRKALAERRSQAIDDLFTAYRKDPASASDRAIDDLVAELEPALRKVEAAQLRPRCAFEMDVDPLAEVPHVAPARRVARLVALKTRRCHDRGDVEAPLRDLAVVLRLARDLRPRGSVICQIVATAIVRDATGLIVPTLLASPALREGHARRILDLLSRHEADAIDGYREGMRAEYLGVRTSLAALVKEPGRLGKVVGSPDPTTGKRDAVADALARALEQQVRANPRDVGETNARIDEYFRDVLAFDRPVTQWPKERLHTRRIRGFGAYSRVAELLTVPGGYGLAVNEARAVLDPRAARCLVALWLWKRRSEQPPTDLAAVVKAAGMPEVPIDPYSGKPLRMAIIDGKPVIYSIGQDGRDDGGRIDSNADRKLGDQTFRLPAIKKPEP